MAGIQYYRYDDVGAPAPLPTTSLLDLVRVVLKACLIEGYGDKPAAGWSIGHDVAGGFSVINAAQDGVVCFTERSSANLGLTVLHSIADGSTAMPSGPGRRSGRWSEEDSSNTLTQNTYVANLGTTSIQSAKCWSLVADENTAHLFLTYSTGTTADPSASFGAAISFGRIWSASGEPNLGILGGATSSNTGSVGSYYGAGAGGTLLRNPLNNSFTQGIAPDFNVSVPAINESISSMHASAPIPTMGRVQIVRPPVIGFGAGVTGSTSNYSRIPVGVVPGLLSVSEFCNCYVATYLKSVGLTGVLAERFDPVTLPDGTSAIIFAGSTSDRLGFISLNPADWVA